MIDIFCLKYGTLYTADHVNLLYEQLKQHALTFDFNLICLTDDSVGINANINIVKIPTNIKLKTFHKILIYDPAILRKTKVLYFDLDVIFHNSIDFLLQDIIRGGVTTVNCTWTRGILNPIINKKNKTYMQGNSSIIGFYGDDEDVHENYHIFNSDIDYFLDNYPSGDDVFLLHYLSEANMFTRGLIYSYLHGVYSSTQYTDFDGNIIDHNFPYIDQSPEQLRPHLNVCLLNNVQNKNLVFELYEKCNRNRM